MQRRRSASGRCGYGWRSGPRAAFRRRQRSQLRNGDLEVRQEFEQERLELVVGAVDFVDQQHRAVRRSQRLQQRPLDQELLGVEVELRIARLAQRQKLARIVPFIKGVRSIDAFVALQADQSRPRTIASILAASVLPTPGAPSSRSGLPICRLRKIAMARPSSAR